MGIKDTNLNHNLVAGYGFGAPRGNGKSTMSDKTFIEMLETVNDNLRTRTIKEATQHYMPRILEEIRKQFDENLATEKNFKAIGGAYLAHDHSFITFSIMGLELFSDKVVISKKL